MGGSCSIFVSWSHNFILQRTLHYIYTSRVYPDTAINLNRLLTTPTLVVVLVCRDSPLRLGRHSSAINRTQAVKANGVLRNSSSNSLGIPLESVQGQVGHVVAFQVVVDVVRDADLTAKELELLLRLDDFGTSEQTARSDSAVQETGVVAAAAEVRGDAVEVVGGEEVFEEALCFGAAGGAGLVVSAAVAVVDSQDVVGRGDHVEVEVEADRGCFFGGQVLGVVVAAQQAEFFARPEAEADCVVDCVAGELLGDFEDTDDTGAVVVDAGAGEDGVGMSADDEDGVFVAADCFGDDVLARRC